MDQTFLLHEPAAPGIIPFNTCRHLIIKQFNPNFLDDMHH